MMQNFKFRNELKFILLIALISYIGTKVYSEFYEKNISVEELKFINDSQVLIKDYQIKFDNPNVKLAVYDRCSVFSLMFQFPPRGLPEAKQFALPEMAYVDFTKATIELIKGSFKDQEATSNTEIKNMDKVTSDYKAYIAKHYLNNKKEDISQDALIRADYEMCSDLIAKGTLK
jgi:hypothetical protein